MFKVLDLFFLLGMGPIYIKNIGTNRRKKPASIVSEIRQDRIATPKEHIFIFFYFCAKKILEGVAISK